MTDPKHRQLREIFERALDLPAERRGAFLETRCAGLPELKQRLEAMLAAADDERFLASPTGPKRAGSPGDLARETREDDPEAEAPLREGPGTRIGPYKLLQQIGEGGFGVVFMAEQEQPVRRKVALKIIKLGMDTRQVVARFEQERQALAMMDHANIARVFDAGATETGRPYFVMELVQGEPIAAYCDRNNLPIEERLELFAQVCRAIQHAHQKGIIHRDLKPSNILVGTQDGRPTVKVIDFGIAKATSQKLTDKTLFTEHKQVIGTFQYMSPEQAEGSLDIDTRTDVYSLGVVLYELLTGTTPFDAATLRDAMYSEIQRMIREDDPPRPSTRVSASNEALASIAARRRVEPARLGKLVRGELDWIVMKALDKDRARRYETPGNLALDIERFLGGEPVLAAPPGNAYRVRKFVRRHRGQVIAAGVILVTLLGGIVGTGLGLLRANRATAREAMARTAAETNLEYARKGNEILGSVFTGLDPTANYATVAELRNALRDNLDASVKALEGSSIGDPIAVARMQTNLGTALNALGEAHAAAEVLAKASATYETVLGPDHADTLTSRNNLALCRMHAGRTSEALTLLEDTLSRRREHLGPEAHDTLTSMASLAQAYTLAGKFDRAVPLLVDTLALHERVLGADHIETLDRMDDLAAAYQAAGKLDEALPLFEKSLSLHEDRLGPDHPSTLTCRNNLAAAYTATGKKDRAVELHEKTLAVRRSRLGPEHPVTLASMNNLAAAYQADGKLELSIPLLEEARKILKTKYGADHPNTLQATANLATCYRDAKKLDLALPLLEETLAHQKAELGADHPSTLTSMGNLAAAYFSLRKLDRSIPLFQDVLQAQEKKLGRKHPATQITVMNLGVNYSNAGRYAEALPLLEETWPAAKLRSDKLESGLDLLNTYLHVDKADEAAALTKELTATIRSSTKPGSAQLAAQLSTLARALLEGGAYAEAEAPLRESLTIREKGNPDSWSTFHVQSMLGGALLGQKKYADAEPLLIAGCEGLLELEAKIPEKSRARLTDSLERLIRLYAETNRPADAARWKDVLEARKKTASAPGK